jgi:hypothetical protein
MMTIDPADEYEEQLMKKIDDKVLRTIFCGLVDKQFEDFSGNR